MALDQHLTKETLPRGCIAGAFACPDGKPLGMEDGRIPDDSLTASSTWRDKADHSPVMARLNTERERYRFHNRNTGVEAGSYSVRMQKAKRNFDVTKIPSKITITLKCA